MNLNNIHPVALNDTKAVKSYFRGDARYGRTTTLMSKGGQILFVGMGICTRAELYRGYQGAAAMGLAPDDKVTGGVQSH